jgi:hypothetical protein
LSAEWAADLRGSSCERVREMAALHGILVSVVGNIRTRDGVFRASARPQRDSLHHFHRGGAIFWTELEFDDEHVGHADRSIEPRLTPEALIKRF